MNRQLLISISLSLVIHILILGLLKFISVKTEASEFSRNSNRLNVLLNFALSQSDNKLSESTLTKSEEIVKAEVHPDKINSNLDQSNKLILPISEPKYYAIKELDQRPEMINEIDTRPRELAQFKEGGEIKIKIWIDENGDVVKSEVIDSNLPLDFIEYTLTSFNQSKFTAGIKDGVPVRSVAKVVVQYAAAN